MGGVCAERSTVSRWARKSRWGGWRTVAAGCLGVAAVFLWPGTNALAEAPSLSLVPGDTQSGGPEYGFYVGVTEITNQQFVDFLNDALANPSNERGHYLYHATDTGNVYLHTAQVGTQGLDVGGVAVLDTAVNNSISFDGNAYVATSGLDNHPVTGVSWYGAAKYCNWLTIDSGLSPSDRAYTEAPSTNLPGWHPVTIAEADWSIRDLNTAERQALLAIAGYRLPMDDEAATASRYNEWYKAAAWNPTAGVDWLYGFGGDVITGADANYWNSGDPLFFATPVGYYDGTNYGGFQTNDTNNAYGLYDLSGNVEEWVQDQGSATDRRGVRGGSWFDTTGSLRNDGRADLPATDASPTTGLRVVQVLPFGLETAVVDGADAQPGGPTHRFRIGVYEVSNAELAAFLNGALDNPGDPRGAYLYHDIDSGDVYINSSAGGVTGTAGSGTLIFDASVGGAISYDGTGQRYRVAVGKQELPAVGVSWYGAAKFCNWLTVESGLPAAQRCYTEASYVGGWHPVTISEADWAIRDLNDAERQTLVDGYLGYRLPMDDGATGSSLYNEWYKAAAWLEAASTNGAYGFGRNAIVAADANYWNSGDPFDDGPTPVGFYDGTIYNSDGLPDEDQFFDSGDFITAANSNGYGLYDLSGNVWEWVQDQAVTTDRRAVRGGSWNSGTTSLRCLARSDVTAGAVTPTTGFRVVQSMPGTLVIAPETDLTATGLYGGPYQGDVSSEDYTVANMTAVAVLLDVTPDRDWITVNGQAVLTNVQIPAFGQLMVTVAIDVNCARADAVLGLDVGTVDFTNSVDSVVETRQVNLTLTEPLSVTPADDYAATGFFGGPFDPAQKTYTIASTSGVPIDWSVTADVDWVDVNSNGQSASGQLAAAGQPGDTVDVTVTLNAQAPAQAAGSYAGTLTFRNECTGQEFTRNLSLQVDPPLTVDPATDLTFIGPQGGPFPPFAAQYLLTNATAASVNWEVVTDVAWLDAAGTSGTSGTLNASDSISITVEPNATASSLGLGDHLATVTFRDTGSGFEETRAVTLTVTELDVTPATDFESSGPVGGPFVPSQKVYTIHNHRPPQSPEMSWRVTADKGWISINGQPSPVFGSIVEPAGTAGISISINNGAGTLTAGTHQATVTFEDLGNGAQTTRYVNLEVGTEDFATPMTTVPASDTQPGGPTYDFRIGRFEVTTAEFAVFLNNAINNPTNPRGQYLFHDTDSGDVYLNDAQTGGAGTNGTGTLMFDASLGGAISYGGQAYVVDPAMENDPVVGVSWYGALKYCNWMTLAQEMDPAQRCYLEGPSSDLDAWRPVTIAKVDWQTRDLDAGERQALLALRGFRLPMDDGSDTASVYNEWYKAAAWLDDAATNSLYGFGPGTLTGADANFFNSGDPFDNDPTPVGFYDGVNLLAGGTPTNDTTNGYLLYDVCGNAQEWIQDWASGAGDRAVRGGSMTNAAGSTLLRNDVRGSAAPASTFSYTGFRVVQSVPDTVVPLTVTPQTPLVATGYVGGAFVTDALTQGLTLNNTDAIGSAEWIATLDQTWVEFDVGSVASGVIPPGGSNRLAFVLTSAADTLTEPAPPAVQMAQVSDTTGQSGGPQYALWVGTYEVTNSGYVTFLNDALNNPDNERGQYLYFDIDTGIVYLNTSQLGEVGTSGETLTATLFEVTTNGQVTFDGSSYSVVAGFGNHPVTGVSWFGATKYCNWLSLIEGAPVHQLAYTEGPYAGDWHPVTISTLNWWGTDDTANNPTPAGGRDLTTGERDTLVQGYTGFRLPMDGGAAAADPHNEWYLAAAWLDDVATNSVYAFGRDSLTGADANYSTNGDPFDPGSTPVGFFDGTIYNSDGLPDQDQVADSGDFQTTDTANAWGIHDLTGNVGEWVQDAGTDSGNHAVRGGSWADPSSSPLLRADGRSVIQAGATDDTIGFRVVQTRRGRTATVTVNDLITGGKTERGILLVLTEPILVQPAGDSSASGPPGGPFALDVGTYTQTNRSASPMDWQVTVDVNWLDINTSGQSDSGQLAATGQTGDSVTVNLAVNATADAFTPDTYDAVLTFTNVTSGHVETRAVTLTVDNSIALAPPDDWEPTGPFYVGEVVLSPPVETTYTLSNQMTVPLGYQVTVDQSWVTLDDGDPVSGTLDATGGPSYSVVVTVGLNDGVNTLGVGEHTATVTFDDTTFGDQIEIGVTLTIDDPLVVTYDEATFPDGHLEADGAFGGPFDPPSIEYTLTNNAGYPVDWQVTPDVTWVDVTGPMGSAGNLFVGGSTTVTVTFNAEAQTLGPGTFIGTTAISNLQTGHDQVFDISLTVDKGLMITPADQAEFAAPVGGAGLPRCVVYRLANLDDISVSWSARTEPPASWVLINGQGSDGGTLGAGQFVDVCVSIDPSAPELGIAGTYAGTIQFDRQGLPTDTRQVTLTVTEPTFALSAATVSGGADQPGGPTYVFEMGVYEVTNAQFAAFLNDALANTGNERGQYLYHDIDSGDVYINSDPSGDGDVGTAGTGTLVFGASAGGAIGYVSGSYATSSGLADHPVAGVTWYGALKFVNWLTIDQGLPKSHRCYVESTADDLLGWRPVTISAANWASRDLDDAERQALVGGYLGYRLPMDDGSNNGQPWADGADAFNEWYKTAAWDPAAGVSRAYGFGRDAITGADANYRDSGDPFDNGPTPIGFFDGTIYDSNGLPDADQEADTGDFVTAASANGYGLYDQCGNVHEWVQDRYASDPDDRAVRGGSFEDGVVWVGTQARSSASASLAWGSIGLRVVRVMQRPGDADGDGDIDGDDYAILYGCLTGPGGGLLSGDCGLVNLDLDGDVDLDDFAAFQTMLEGP